MDLIVRGLFNKNDDDASDTSSNHTCASAGPDPDQVPLVGNLTFHKFTTILSGVSAILACLISFYLIFRHATNYSLPKEQKHIIRIIFMIPVFAFISFISVALPEAEIYIHPIADIYEALALASFFLLLCAFVDEDDTERQAFFHSSGILKQHISATIGAFQFPVVMTVLLFVIVVTQAIGRYCETWNNIYFAHIWVIGLTIASTVVAIMSILRFYKVLKPTINHRKPLSKLLAFKAIVFLGFVQNIIFSYLTSSSHAYLAPSPHHTSSDLKFGLPNTLLCIEMFLFSLLFLYVYRTADYIFRPSPTSASKVPLGHGGYQGGFLGIRAYAQAANISDIIRGIASVPTLFIGRKKVAWNAPQGETGRAQFVNIEMSGENSGAGMEHAPQEHYPQHMSA